MSNVVQLSDVTLRRDTTQILGGISWSVAPTDRWVVLGPNGAGKTSLISIAAGKTYPSTGTAVVLGEKLGKTDIRELGTRIGLSSAALAEYLPAEETVRNLVMTAAYGVAGRWRETYDELDEQRADALLAAFGMSDFAQRTFGTLSEGERKRTQIARALMTDPELLILDEPAAGLDLGGREELLGALTELASDKRSPAMVLVTHHVEEIPQGFTHALLLKDGLAVAQGPLLEALTEANLERTYGMKIRLTADAGRFTARRA